MIVLNSKTADDNNNKKLIQLTEKWWFYLILILIGFFIPVYASKGYLAEETMDVIILALSTGLKPYIFLSIIFHFLIIVFIISLFIFKGKFIRVFIIFITINYFLAAILQNIVITEKFGLVIPFSNMILILIVAISWLYEGISNKTKYEFEKQPIWKYWVVPLAVLAYWLPMDGNAMPDFNPVYFITSESMIAFCNITPIYLAIFSFLHPNYNTFTIRITSFVGIYFGILAISFIFFNIFIYWWLVIMHLPLLTISLYMFILSFKNKEG